MGSEGSRQKAPKSHSNDIARTQPERTEGSSQKVKGGTLAARSLSDICEGAFKKFSTFSTLVSYDAIVDEQINIHSCIVLKTQVGVMQLSQLCDHATV